MTSSQVQVSETPAFSEQDIESLRDENGLIAGKFKTAADMVNSYKELEGKLGAIDQTAEESTVAATALFVPCTLTTPASPPGF